MNTVTITYYNEKGEGPFVETVNTYRPSWWRKLLAWLNLS
jgi:hypothetical protein